MFNIGDKVRGIPGNGYCITNEDAVCEVCGIYSNTNEMYVRVISTEDGCGVGEVFDVDPYRFVLVEGDTTFEEENGEHFCEHCGDKIDLSEHYVKIGNKYYCKCCEELYVYCDCCGKWVLTDDIYQCEDSDDLFCEDCYYDRMYVCSDCDTHYRYESSGGYVDDYWYCDNCYDSHNYSSEIHEYHSEGYFETFGENDLRFGMEIEVSHKYGASWGDLNKYAGKVREIMGSLIYDIQEDCSIDNGFEIILNPMDYKYYQNTGRAKLEEMLKYLQDNDFETYPSSCGCHIHMSKQPIEAKNTEFATDMNYIFEVFKEDLQHYAKRKNNSYAYFLSDVEKTYNGTEYSKDVKYFKVKELVDKFGRDKYRAVNFGHYDTIELRLFQSSLDINDYDTYMKIAYNSAMCVKNSSFMNKTFKQIFHLENISNNKTSKLEYEKIIYKEYENKIKNIKKEMIDFVYSKLDAFRQLDYENGKLTLARIGRKILALGDIILWLGSLNSFENFKGEVSSTLDISAIRWWRYEKGSISGDIYQTLTDKLYEIKHLIEEYEVLRSE